MTHTLNSLRLVKAQVASKEHDCSECIEPIAIGERYMRAALPRYVEQFPSPDKVAQEDAWKYVDGSWTIEKTHELCYTKRYFRPIAFRNEDVFKSQNGDDYGPSNNSIDWGRRG